MLSTSPTKLVLLRWILTRNEFSTPEISREYPSLSKQTVNNHLSEWIKEGALERVQRGHYRVLDRDQMMNLYDIEKKYNPDTRHVQPKYWLPDASALGMNTHAKNIQAFRSIGHPVARRLTTRYDKFANEVITEYVQFQKLMRHRIPPLEAHRHLIDLGEKEIKYLMQKVYPDDYEDQYAELLKLLKLVRERYEKGSSNGKTE